MGIETPQTKYTYKPEMGRGAYSRDNNEIPIYPAIPYCDTKTIAKVDSQTPSAGTVLIQEQIRVVGATYTDAGVGNTGGTVTRTNAFIDYTYHAGDTFTVISATGGTIVGSPITITGKTDNSNIVLATDLFTTDVNGTAVSGYITYNEIPRRVANVVKITNTNVATSTFFVRFGSNINLDANFALPTPGVPTNCVAIGPGETVYLSLRPEDIYFSIVSSTNAGTSLCYITVFGTKRYY